MTYVKKTFIVLLILTTLNFYIPGIAISGEIILSSRDNITTHLPESVSTPEKEIPGETTTVTSEKGGKKWLWQLSSSQPSPAVQQAQGAAAGMAEEITEAAPAA